MSGTWVVQIVLADGEDATKWIERASEMCRCRKHWWQVWRRERTCFYDAISAEWQDDDDVRASAPPGTAWTTTKEAR